MEHSIAAKYAARPAARFPRPSSRTRERRLGLRVEPAFRAAPPLRAPPRRLPLHHPHPDAPDGDGSPAPGRLDDLVAFGPAGTIERRRGAVARLRSATATSAGGIVVRIEGDPPGL